MLQRQRRRCSGVKWGAKSDRTRARYDAYAEARSARPRCPEVQPGDGKLPLKAARSSAGPFSCNRCRATRMRGRTARVMRGAPKRATAGRQVFASTEQPGLRRWSEIRLLPMISRSRSRRIFQNRWKSTVVPCRFLSKVPCRTLRQQGDAGHVPGTGTGGSPVFTSPFRNRVRMDEAEPCALKRNVSLRTAEIRTVQCHRLMPHGAGGGGCRRDELLKTPYLVGAPECAVRDAKGDVRLV